ncbi:MAG: hypothetical protein AAFO69_14605, partial [Bacteroidota bacterium]
MRLTKLTAYGLNLLFCLLLLGGLRMAYANDSQRKVDDEKVEALKRDGDFDYARNYQVQEDPVEKFLNWLKVKFFEMISAATGGGPMQNIALVIIGLIITFAVLKLLDIDPT